MSRQLTNQETNEIKRCKEDFLYFIRYLKIINKDNKLISLNLNDAQKIILQTLDQNNLLKILKARQLGSSTFIAAYFFWKTFFRLNERTAVVAHTHDAVKNIYSIYETFYNNLPKFMRETIKTKQDNANTLSFVTGSSIKIGSASSEAFRGSSALTNLHLSEVAFWADMNKTVTSMIAAASNNPTIIYETTANGLNDFYEFWKTDNGYSSIFLSWFSDNNNRRKSYNPKYKQIMEHQKEFFNLLPTTIDEEQKNWAIDIFTERCLLDLAKFKQEYAPDPIICFITSGDRFFNQTFFLDDKVTTGYKRYQEKQSGRIYSIGVDTASGSQTGDYSAFIVLDITSKDRPIIVATYYDRVELFVFADIVYKECMHWDAYAVIEKNSYGLTVIEYLRGKEYGFMFTTSKYDKATDQYTELFGFNTNQATRPLLLTKVQEFVNKGKILVDDTRLQREINNFVYIDEKAQASRNNHDDLIISLALALIAYDQYEYVRQNKMVYNPQSREEWRDLQINLGLPKKELIRQGYVADCSPTNRSVFQW